MKVNSSSLAINSATSFPISPGPLQSDAAQECVLVPACRTEIAIDQDGSGHLRPLSRWSASISKRLFDLTSISIALPLIVPIFVIVGAAVRLTSRGPVLFRQQRVGRNGRLFTILKFRTMPVLRVTAERPAIASSENQLFTPVGPFLRCWKLDELPQLINIICGDMSLVGPRPKLPKHQQVYFCCRPGLTGGATIVFAREEVSFSNLPGCHLENYYHSVVLPAKQQLDDDYMARATFTSDLKLIFKSVFRRWDDVPDATCPRGSAREQS
jgi:lipopolysaccharide/colanic/teichoic acid biosynthesis glycosyltransferase